ncbi:hypothetical protein C0991_002605, partial [Blastosporella zonata]
MKSAVSHLLEVEGRNTGPPRIPHAWKDAWVHPPFPTYRIKILPQPYKPLSHPVLEPEEIEVEERAVRVGPRVQGVQEARELEC